MVPELQVAGCVPVQWAEVMEGFSVGGMRLVFLPPDEVAKRWGEVAPLFEKTVDKACHGEFSAADLYAMALAGDVAIGVATDEAGAVFMALALEEVCYPRLRAVNVLAMGGKRLDVFMKRFLLPFRMFCREQGIDRITCLVSPGMERMHRRYGFETVYRMLSMDVEE